MSEMLRLDGWEGLREHICNHVGGGAVNQSHFALLNHPADEMKTNIDMLRASVIDWVCAELDGFLVITVEGCRMELFDVRT